MNLRPGLLAGVLGSLISAAAAAVAMASSADAPVVLLGTADDEPLTGRIAAELRALGIGIEIRVISGDARGIEMEVESALREGARAAVRIDAQMGRTEVSIPDPATRQVALKQVLEGPPTTALAPVLAVRTVEFVRATLLGPRNEDVRRGRGERVAGARDAATPDGEVVGSPPTSEAYGGEASGGLAGMGLALESGAVFTPGGVDTALAVGIAARLRLFPHIGLELMGFTPLTSEHFNGTLISTRASTWLTGGGLFLRQPLGARGAVEVGTGAMLALLQTTGTVMSDRKDLTGQSDWTAGGSAYVRLGADLAVARNLALRLDLLAGGAFRQALIRVDDTNPSADLRAWGRAFAAALGGVEARWF